MMEPPARWALCQLALRLLAIDPAGLGGAVIRARISPVRSALLTQAAAIPLPVVKLHPAMGDDALFGGIDLSATLSAGHIMRHKGLLSSPACLHLTMAERCPPSFAVRLAQVLDQPLGHCLLALDEGAEADERAPATLADRLAFRLDLDGIGHHDMTDEPFVTDVAPLPPNADPVQILVVTAARLGIDGLRAPMLALRAARALAKLDERDSPDATDLTLATLLVLAPRATQMPAQQEPEAEQPPEPEQPEAGEQDTSTPQLDDLPEELLIEAVRALLPANLLTASGGAVKGAKGAGAGARVKGNRRGRPLPARPGRLDGRARIDLVATLRSAAPWQTLRGRDGAKLMIQPSDIRLKRFEDLSDRLIIFAVDASGSAALARLGEAKGAVELLLAEAYARRDHVALIAFRGTGAELLLPPTRSLVQTKKRLSGLPGGGGTPLAAGLRAAGELAMQARRQGLSPTIALLTDGRANIALDGRADRAQATEDADQMARWLRGMGTPAIVLDAGMRPLPALKALSALMGGTYLPLPRADARSLSATVNAALES